MRLFLASQDFGNHAATLRKMVGPNRKTLIITNARDYASVDEKQELMNRKTRLFEEADFIVAKLDLRKYFGKTAELEKFIDEYNPGLIYAVGGNVFLLRTALHASGMDEILIRKLKSDKLVYGGGSAGAMVTAPKLTVYADTSDSLRTPEIVYGLPAITKGLNFIDGYIIPHVGHPELGLNCEKRQQKVLQIHGQPIMLNDSQVYLVDNKENKVI